MNNSNLTPTIQQSITGSLNELANDYLTVNEDNGKIATAAKLAGGTLAYTALATVGFAETVVRNAFAVLAKTGHFFVPEKFTEKFNLDQKVVSLFSHAAITTEYTAKTTARIVTNFMNVSKRAEIQFSIVNKIMNFYQSNPMV